MGRVTVGLRGHTNAAVSHKMERGREAAVSHKEERDRKAAGRAVEGKAARVAVRDREAAVSHKQWDQQQWWSGYDLHRR